MSEVPGTNKMGRVYMLHGIDYNVSMLCKRSTIIQVIDHAAEDLKLGPH